MSRRFNFNWLNYVGLFLGVCGVILWMLEIGLGRRWTLSLLLGSDSGFDIIPLHLAVFFLGLLLYVSGRVVSILRGGTQGDNM